MANGKKAQSTELAILDPSKWQICKQTKEQLWHLYSSAFDGPVDEFSFDRIKMTSGGALGWQVPTPDGPEIMKEFEAVAFHVKPARGFWRMGLDEGGGRQPPDCVSNDANTGRGNRHIEGETSLGPHQCEFCPHAQFGSDRRKDGKPGRGQACKATYRLFTIDPDSVIPSIVILPPTSLKAFGNYRINVVAKHFKTAVYNVVTRFGVEKMTNKDGIAYGVATFSVSARLDGELVEKLAERLSVLRDFLKGQGEVKPEDFTSAE